MTLLEQHKLSREATFQKRVAAAVPVVTFDLLQKKPTTQIPLAERAAYIRKAATLPELHRLVAHELVGLDATNDDDVEKACRRVIKALVLDEVA